jgi:hypothetical protein
VQYRLAQMDPEPSLEPVLTRPDEVPMSRVSVMRAEMGLPPIEPSDMARFMEGGVRRRCRGGTIRQSAPRRLCRRS